MRSQEELQKCEKHESKDFMFESLKPFNSLPGEIPASGRNVEMSVHREPASATSHASVYNQELNEQQQNELFSYYQMPIWVMSQLGVHYMSWSKGGLNFDDYMKRFKYIYDLVEKLPEFYER